MIKRILFIALFVLPCMALAEVYKCPGPDGKLGFSDRPCQATGLPHQAQQEIEIKAPNGGLVGPPQDWVDFMDKRDGGGVTAGGGKLGVGRTGPCADFGSSELRRYKVQNRVVRGMTVGDAISAWGAPTRKNGTQYAYHWDDDNSSYFYVENGCVTSVSGGYGRKY